MLSVETPPRSEAAVRRHASLARAAYIAFAIAFAAHFFRFSRAGLRSWFSNDDAMNLFLAWTRPYSELFASCFAVFVPYTRPLGQAYYLLLYRLFGFDPLPFNVVRLAVAALDVVVLYLFVSRVLRSRTAGLCALLLAGVHPALFSIYFDTGMIYDTLAFLFYWLTFWVYVGIRQRGAVPGWRAMLGLLALHTCALNSKEIAVTLPLGILLYELALAPPRLTRPALGRWLTREGRFALAGALLTALYLAPRLYSKTSLYSLPGYRPDYSPETYFGTYGTYVSEFLARSGALPWPVLAALLAGGIVAAVLTRRRVLLWAALFNVVAVLPIAFIPPRLGFAFYVPLMGWAVLLAGLLDLAREAAVKRIHAGPRFGPAARDAAARFFLVALLAGVVVPFYIKAAKSRYYGAQNRQDQIRTWYREIRYVLPEIPPHSRILLLREPPQPEWTLQFLLPLATRDRSTTVRVVRQLKAMNAEIKAEDFTLFVDYEGDHFRLVSRGEIEELIQRKAL
ncbi:MAG TPA: glycosyltransferase family 39 protein [Bryobacteraceae bacterium]|nr:glycosyltransferase family 39 protein [Bryobacteraceae bacterium]